MTEDLEKGPAIKAGPRPTCLLCGSPGVPLYEGLEDRLFAASGRWHFAKCPNGECGMIWLNPMPLPEEIGKAYAKYYTHSVKVTSKQLRLGRRFYHYIRLCYWALKYGYRCVPRKHAIILGPLLYFFPQRRRVADGDIRELKPVSFGRLLDVGSGTGEWLGLMRTLGWTVSGVDFDEKAVEVARNAGLDVDCGALEDQGYLDGSYDVVTLNHVIEHLPDPVKTLKECARILKPGGKLMLATPNGESFGHAVFKRNWRGLEPPRHLHIFCMQSVEHLLQTAGFTEIVIRPHVARSVIYESLMLSTNQGMRHHRRNHLAGSIAWLFNALEILLIPWKPSLADCMTAFASKHEEG